MKFSYPEGATPIDSGEAEGLIPLHITLQRELNEWEALNILEGSRWAWKSSRAEILSDHYIRKLHEKMFDQTWTWAGTYRVTGKNIGVPAFEISEQVHNLCEDAKRWIKESVYPAGELAVRFHHRLVWIHPFPDGNGRHARLMADLLADKLGQKTFSWGSSNLTEPDDFRNQYLAALRCADKHDFQPLIAFARS